MLAAMERKRAIEPTSQRVYDQALRWLARRAYGEEELRRRLLAQGAPTAWVEQALARCRELGYLNDAAFAASLARHRLGQSGQGAARVRAELQARGLASETVTAALAEAQAENDPLASARAALAKRFGLQPAADRRELKRRFDFLTRRGFAGDVIWRALERRAGEDDDDSDG